MKLKLTLVLPSKQKTNFEFSELTHAHIHKGRKRTSGAYTIIRDIRDVMPAKKQKMHFAGTWECSWCLEKIKKSKVEDDMSSAYDAQDIICMSSNTYGQIDI